MTIARHTYPSKYPPGVHWAVDIAWQILDVFEPGALTADQRALLAGMIAGALMEVRQQEQEKK